MSKNTLRGSAWGNNPFFASYIQQSQSQGRLMKGKEREKYCDFTISKNSKILSGPLPLL